jgi:hypothetical protein
MLDVMSSNADPLPATGYQRRQLATAWDNPFGHSSTDPPTRRGWVLIIGMDAEGADDGNGTRADIPD